MRWSISAVFFVNGFVFASWVPHIPLVMERQGLSASQLGLVLLGMAVGAMGALLFAGAFVSRFGSRLVTTVCALGFCLALPFPVLAPDPVLTTAALLLFGALNATLDVAMNAQAAQLEQRYAQPMMSSFHGFFSLGGLAGAASAAVALGAGVTPASHALATAVLGAAAVGLASRRLLPSSRGSGPSAPVFVLPSRALLGLGALTFLALLIEGAVGDWSAVYLHRERGLDPGTAALGFAAFSMTMAACRFGGDILARRLGQLVLLRVSAVAAAAGFALALLSRHPATSIAGFGLVGLGMANVIPLLFSAAGRAGDPGRALAAVATTGYLGFLAGPPMIGFAAEQAGLTAGLGMLGVMAALVAVGSRLARGSRPRQRAGNTPC
jgi:predicted MFS family arabinose efflux permease